MRPVFFTCWGYTVSHVKLRRSPGGGQLKDNNPLPFIPCFHLSPFSPMMPRLSPSLTVGDAVPSQPHARPVGPLFQPSLPLIFLRFHRLFPPRFNHFTLSDYQSAKLTQRQFPEFPIHPLCFAFTPFLLFPFGTAKSHLKHFVPP